MAMTEPAMSDQDETEFDPVHQLLIAAMRGEIGKSLSSKRTKKSFATQKKIEAVDRVMAGESKASVARDTGVAESTLRGWCKAEAKIRALLARSNGSATPPSSSEPLSPASSLGDCTAGPSNLSSEDEAVRPAPSKRLRLGETGGDGARQNSSPVQSSPSVDYMSSLISSLLSTGGGSNSDTSYLLQQLGMLSSAQASQALTKQLIGLSSQPQSVGLVENGLQYKLSSKSRSSSQGLASHHVSAQAPAPLDVAGKSGSRKSLPPAAEAPSTPLPVTPRRSADSSLSGGQPLSSSATSTSSSASRKHSEALYMWFMQQQLNQGHGYNGAVDGSWFWQWYKQNSVPPVSQQSAAAAASLPLSSPASQAGHLSHLSSHHSASRSSPTKVRAVLDNVLSSNNNNNNDNGRTSLNSSTSASRYATEPDENLLDMSTSGNGSAHRAAIQHGEELIKYLDTYSDPSVTQVQIMQFRSLLDNLKGTARTPTLKRSRK